ncbi:hypothetical protein BLOT_000105 [Blomia tropicalis]|nr:hypothetical protein BLOT_000105 [Blomia tropicalis]
MVVLSCATMTWKDCRIYSSNCENNFETISQHDQSFWHDLVDLCVSTGPPNSISLADYIHN